MDKNQNQEKAESIADLIRQSGFIVTFLRRLRDSGGLANLPSNALRVLLAIITYRGLDCWSRPNQTMLTRDTGVQNVWKTIQLLKGTFGLKTRPDPKARKNNLNRPKLEYYLPLGEPPVKYNLAIKTINAGDGACSICQKSFHFYQGPNLLDDNGPVCWKCGRTHAPDLAKLLTFYSNPEPWQTIYERKIATSEAREKRLTAREARLAKGQSVAARPAPSSLS